MVPTDELTEVIEEMTEYIDVEHEIDLDKLEEFRDKLKRFQEAIDRDEIVAKTLVLNTENITINHVKSIEHISDVDLGTQD